MGANGSGKTSCALQVAGLAGAAGDEAAPGRGSAARVSAGRRVGVSFQDPDSQIVAPVVRDDVAFGPENLGIPREEMLEIVNQALVEAGIEELSGREVDTLSGGQKQRVAVAGLLALAPGLVVFDEATAMLDPAARASFGRLVRRLCDSGVAVIQATQVMEEALATDRVAVFDAGRIVRVSEPSEVLADEALLAGCGLRAPESVRLARAMAALGVNARDGADGGVASRTATLDDLEEAICRWYAEV